MYDFIYKTACANCLKMVGELKTGQFSNVLGGNYVQIIQTTLYYTENRPCRFNLASLTDRNIRT